MQEFEEETAVVTGAGSGIGRALGLAFAAEGMRVAMADIDVGPGRDGAARLGGAVPPVDVDDSASAT